MSVVRLRTTYLTLSMETNVFKRISMLGLAVAAMAACADRLPTETGEGQLSGVASESLDFATKGIIASVTGSGHLWTNPPGEEERPALRNFTIAATKAADGSVGGQYNLLTATGLHVKGTITCLNVVGDRAFVGGTWESNPEFPFEIVGVALEFVDGGNGPDAMDQISSLGFYPADFFDETDVQAYCDDALEGPVTPIDLGSIRVD